MSADPPDRAAALDGDAIREVAAGVEARDKLAISRALNLVEDRRPERAGDRAALLDLLGRPVLGRPGAAGVAGDVPCGGHRVGFTGPPGVGKSTLIAAVICEMRARGQTVGVLAVDPSSPRSGGALLGDRLRLIRGPADPGVFVRSVATAGLLGGLNESAAAAVEVLGAAHDVVVIETTGVGQTEADIDQVADTVVLVVQPGSGDALQFLKAGLMEIPDLFVVTKADLGELAERAERELVSALAAIGPRPESAGGVPRVILLSATTGVGVDALVAALARHRQDLGDAGVRARRAAGRCRWVLAAFQRRHGQHGLDQLGGRAQVEARVAAAIAAGEAAGSVVDLLGMEYLTR